MTTSSDPRTPAAARRHDDNRLRLELRGELDHYTSPQLLGEAVAALAERGRAQTLSIDCHGLTFIDSVGLSALLEIHRDAARADVTAHLTNVGPQLERLLHLTGTYTHLTGAAEQESTS
ncbi:STAS domain-containing protein [Streptomyces sp. NPDC049916]|uniref:STAS domain-containing protein n=1 Tax=Streptomyces sp. NPDC049916 TaxID=3155156 RepID=UPI0034375D49